jgi:hypothetical protein
MSILVIGAPRHAKDYHREGPAAHEKRNSRNHHARLAISACGSAIIGSLIFVAKLIIQAVREAENALGA